MKPSAHCAALVKQFEGLATKAYICPAGHVTIGYGHTQGVKLGEECTVAWAEQTLDADLAAVGKQIMVRAVKDDLELSQNEFDALCSFAFNLGASKLFGSTLWRKLKAGDHAGAADEFPRWNKSKDRHGNTITLAGLTKRRQAERAMFLGN